MTIRKATIQDAECITTCLLLAMEDIVFRFIGKKDHSLAREFMFHLVQMKGNQYSYENCWVAEIENRVVAAVNLYNGGQLHELRSPVLQYLDTRFGRQIIPEDETTAGEYYIDTLGVLPEFQGKGIGSSMLKFLIEEFAIKEQKVLGLLVEGENYDAKKLYLKFGFVTIGERTLVGKNVEHLQLKH